MQAIQYVHSVPVHSECDVGDELPIKGSEREGSDMGLAAKRERREKEAPTHSLCPSYCFFSPWWWNRFRKGNPASIKKAGTAFHSSFFHPRKGVVVFLLLTLPAY